MHNWQTSKYKKVVGISEENYAYLLKTKGKKSIAGKLDEIIKSYVSSQKCLENN